MIKEGAIRKGSVWWKLMILFWFVFIPALIVYVLVNSFFGVEWQRLFGLLSSVSSIGWILLSLILLPLNIFLEAKKWQLAVVSIERISLFNSIKAVLEGCSLNAITPFGLGDVYSRVNKLKESARKNGVGSILLVRFTQSIPTWVLGGVSLIFMLNKGIELGYIYHVFIGFVILSLSTVIWFLKSRKSLNNKLRQFLEVLIDSNAGFLLNLTMLSFTRYMVFTLQFLFVFMALQYPLEVELILLGIFWVFLFKSIIPDFTVFGDLTKREISAITFFSMYSGDVSLVAVSSFLIWVINIVVPAIVGLYFVPKNRAQWN